MRLTYLFAVSTLAVVLAATDSYASLTELSVNEAKNIGFSFSVTQSSSRYCTLHVDIEAPESIGDNTFRNMSAALVRDGELLFTSSKFSADRSISIRVSGELMHYLQVIADYETEKSSIGIRINFEKLLWKCD